MHVAHRLRISDFGAISLRRTTSDRRNASKKDPVTEWVALPNEGIVEKSILLVDDIVGEGKTLDAARAALKRAGGTIYTCALAVNLRNLQSTQVEDVVDAYGLLSRDWIIFPWN